jgi:lipopolysaccharide/colanic/teichoic acid biosynthesis glycosyltransferase
LIIIEDGFPVFIRQGRIGKGGQMFKSIKFRSMNKETLRERINLQACEGDTRVTRVGYALRKIAMDELPQLINILLGEMSFVGPRALLPVEIETGGNSHLQTNGYHAMNHDKNVQHIRDIPGYEERIRVTPGLTGIAQIYAPRDLPRRDKFKYDLLYIKHMSFWNDLRLIALSFIISFRGKWEHRGNKLGFLKKV